jgi:hypothetical protein
MTDIIEPINETAESVNNMTDEEFVAQNISSEALKLLEVFVEPDGENKTVFWTSDPHVLCNVYMALRDNFSSIPEVTKLVATELVERQKQAQLQQILNERAAEVGELNG